jgi:anti-anti-sigma regulatory factor
MERSKVMTANDLSPLALQRAGDCLRFTFAPQEEILPELPANYEEQLATRLRGLLAEPGQLSVEIDLQNLAALSSRQLGSLIALQKVLRARFGRVPMVNVSAGVRHLIELTRTGQLFDLP